MLGFNIFICSVQKSFEAFRSLRITQGFYNLYSQSQVDLRAELEFCYPSFKTHTWYRVALGQSKLTLFILID